MTGARVGSRTQLALAGACGCIAGTDAGIEERSSLMDVGAPVESRP